MTRRHQAFAVRDHSPVDDDDAFDERGVIRDGYGVRVPLFMMDSMQKAVRADARRRKAVERDPMGRVRSTFEEEEADAMMTDAELSLHRPGYRTLGTLNDDEAVRAYNDSVREKCNAWRKRDERPAGAYPYDPGREGQACTIDGRPGTLQRRGDALVCVPNGESSSNSDAVPRTMDAATAQRIRDQAWEEMCERQRNAWKTKP